MTYGFDAEALAEVEAWWRTFNDILALPVARPGDYPAEEWCP